MTTQVAETPVAESGGLESKKNRFFTLSLDLFLIAGFDGYIKQLNPICEKTLGFTAEEFLTKPWIEFIHPKDREATIIQFQELSVSAETISYENRFRCKDGQYRWLSWHATLCHEEQLIYATARDITESKQAQEALRESEERFRLLVKNVKDYAIYMLDVNGRVVSWNKGAEGINGYQAEEIIGQHFSCFFPSEDVTTGKPALVLKKAATTGRFECETWRQRKDGSQFWANVVVTALRDENGFLRGYATVTQDITERKQSQEALQQANDELERRVEERTAELQQANLLLKQQIAERERTEKALRQSKTHLKEQAKKLEQTVHELQSTQAQLIQAEKMSSLGQLVAGVAHEINNPVSFIYGNVEYASHYMRDLMQLLKLYNQHYPAPAEEIQTHIEAIDLSFVLADMPKLLSSMKVGADRIREIVLGLRNFSRHDQAEKKLVNIHEGIDSTLLILQHRLKTTAGHPEIKIIKEYTDLPQVECYAGQLNQVFMNLLSNCIDALEDQSCRSEVSPSPVGEQRRKSPQLPAIPNPTLAYQEGEGAKTANPQIQICTEILDCDQLVIRISDNGPGMTPEVRSKLFDPFFTTKPVGKGTGLGLSISYQIIVEKHGGQLTCISEPGKGAEFVIQIPVQQLHSQPIFSQCA